MAGVQQQQQHYLGMTVGGRSRYLWSPVNDGASAIFGQRVPCRLFDNHEQPVPQITSHKSLVHPHVIRFRRVGITPDKVRHDTLASMWTAAHSQASRRLPLCFSRRSAHAVLPLGTWRLGEARAYAPVRVRRAVACTRECTRWWCCHLLPGGGICFAMQTTPAPREARCAARM